MNLTTTETVIQTFQTMGVKVMNTRVHIETVDATIAFCETYGFEQVYPEDAGAMEVGPLKDGEPFMYLWRDTFNETNEMRAGIWKGMGVLPKNGMSFVFKLAETSNLWTDWAVTNNITINGDVHVEGDVNFGDKVYGDKTTGDQINVVIAPGSSDIAVGRGAKASGGIINVSSTMNNVKQTIWN